MRELVRRSWQHRHNLLNLRPRWYVKKCKLYQTVVKIIHSFFKTTMINLMREMQEKINRLEANQAQPKQLTPQLPPLPSPMGIQSVAGPSSSNLNTSYTALPPFSSLFNQTPTKDQSLDFITTLSGRSVRKRNYGENQDEGIWSSIFLQLFNLLYFFDQMKKITNGRRNKTKRIRKARSSLRILRQTIARMLSFPTRNQK